MPFIEKYFSLLFLYAVPVQINKDGRLILAQINGKTEIMVAKLHFKKVCRFRPGFMKITPDQKNAIKMYKYVGWLFPVFKALLPNSISTLKQVGQAMINCLITGSDKQILEVRDKNKLGNG